MVLLDDLKHWMEDMKILKVTEGGEVGKIREK
jgi:hypothetical protein